MYTILKVHFSPFQQDLNFGNGVRNVWVIQKFVGKIKKKTQFLSNKKSLEDSRNIKKNILFKSGQIFM